MSETISSPIEEKGRLSFFYDKNWKPFQLFIRKRFALPRRVLRNIYDESFYQLAKEANTPSEDNAIPLKIKLFRKGTELILQSDKGEKERTDSKAFEEEWQQQELYIGIYRLVRVWLAERENIQDLAEEDILDCIRKVAGKARIGWPDAEHTEMLKRQKQIGRYLSEEMKQRERFELERLIDKDNAFRLQYEATTLFSDTEDNVADDREKEEIFRNWSDTDLQAFLKEKRNNRRFLWQAALLALILFLLNLLMKAF